MNRMKFSEGGQPVYLDDLRLLQDNSKSAAEYLLSAIGRGQSTMLLESPYYSYTEDDAGEFVIKVSEGSAFVNGDFVSWGETVVYDVESKDDLWLCIRETDNDKRIFDDGQQRACSVCREVYISGNPTGAAAYFKLTGLRDICDYIQELIGYQVRVWKDVSVSFFNGYKGTVRYKEMDDCYRVQINIRSTNIKDISGTLALFYTDNSFLQYFYSSGKACVRTENGVRGCHIYGFEGCVHLDVQLPFDDAMSAADVPVKMIFEIPK